MSETTLQERDEFEEFAKAATEVLSADLGLMQETQRAQNEMFTRNSAVDEPVDEMDVTGARPLVLRLAERLGFGQGRR
jgi:hypothetical protein